MQIYIPLVVIAGLLQLQSQGQPVRNPINHLPDSARAYSANGDSSQNENLCLLGEAYFKKGNIPEGKKYFMAAIKHYQAAGNKEREAATWLRLGEKLHSEENSYTESLSILAQALKLYQSITGKETETSEAMYFISYIFISPGHPKEILFGLIYIGYFYIYF